MLMFEQYTAFSVSVSAMEILFSSFERRVYDHLLTLNLRVKASASRVNEFQSTFLRFV